MRFVWLPAKNAPGMDKALALIASDDSNERDDDKLLLLLFHQLCPISTTHFPIHLTLCLDIVPHLSHRRPSQFSRPIPSSFWRRKFLSDCETIRVLGRVIIPTSPPGYTTTHDTRHFPPSLNPTLDCRQLGVDMCSELRYAPFQIRESAGIKPLQPVFHWQNPWWRLPWKKSNSYHRQKWYYTTTEGKRRCRPAAWTTAVNYANTDRGRQQCTRPWHPPSALGFAPRRL